MSKRRDVFIFVAEPGKDEAAQAYLGEWLRSLDGHPGYLGGTADAVRDGAPLLLKFSRGNGLLARMLHIHAAQVDEFVTAG